MRKKDIIIVAVFLLVVIAAIVIVAVKKNQEQQEKEIYKIELKLNHYTNILRIDGDFTIETDRITIVSMEQNEPKLKREIILYNVLFKDHTVTYDELMNAFYEYCDNPEQSNLLDAYADGMDTIYDEYFGSYREYENRMMSYLEEKGIAYENASEQEIEEACIYAAEEMYNHQ